MRLKDLERFFGKYHELTVQQWACVYLLGECRRATNERLRADTSNRGKRINQLVDLQGSLGDLMIFGLVRRLGDRDAVRYMKGNLYRKAGGRKVKGPDLSFK